MTVIQRCTKVLMSLGMTFFPLIIVMVILFVFGRISELSGRSDLMLLTAVLFAEGFWRSRTIAAPDKEASELLGFLGAVISTIFACIIVLRELGALTIESTAFDVNFGWAQLVAYPLAVLYAFIIRYRETG